MAKEGLVLYTACTPNGWKASVTLEELGVPYTVRGISMWEGEQKQDWFLKINPNGRIPALVDHNNGDQRVFESGSIMLYLAERDPEAKLLPKGGVGPMQGQSNHFRHYAGEQIPYAIDRYTKETERLYLVMEDALKGKQYLVGEQYTLADIANFCWVRMHAWAGVSLDDKPNLKEWHDRIEARPAVQRGVNVPTPDMLPNLLEDIKAKGEAIGVHVRPPAKK